MDMTQRPLAKLASQYFSASGELMYTTVIDFSAQTETVTNPRNGKKIVFRIDRNTGQRAGKIVAST
jgi:hypothetical protein